MLLRYMLCAYAKHLEKPQNYQKIAAKDAEKNERTRTKRLRDQTTEKQEY